MACDLQAFCLFLMVDAFFHLKIKQFQMFFLKPLRNTSHYMLASATYSF